MPRGRRLVALLPVLGFLLALAAPRARAHGLAPVLLEISARADGTASILWKTAPSLPRGARLEPVLPGHCRTIGVPTTGATPEGVTRSWQVDCGPAGLVGESIAVRDLDVARTDALVRLALPDGREIRAVLRGERPDFVVPRRPSAAESFAGGVREGLARLAGRADALLFVAGLVLLARDRGSLAAALAAFALASSVTLLGAGLGAIVPRAALADFLAATSVVAIAAEVAREDADTRARRSPWVPAMLLGAVHGLTLAPGPERSPNGDPVGTISLLGHHLGVEAALLLAAAGLGAAWLAACEACARGGRTDLPADLARALAYPVGCAAAFLAFRGAAGLVS
ncbi:HupE/UreJ family protein [bacterium]|nr:HupE/UreJ family protein [bacterium]